MAHSYSDCSTISPLENILLIQRVVLVDNLPKPPKHFVKHSLQFLHSLRPHLGRVVNDDDAVIAHLDLWLVLEQISQQLWREQDPINAKQVFNTCQYIKGRGQSASSKYINLLYWDVSSPLEHLPS